MKSPIRWAGSKRQLLSTLRAFWPGGSARYIEAFAGSACLFFDIEPPNAILCDLNPDLIRAYRALRDDYERVSSHLKRMKPSRDFFMRLRAKNPEKLTRSAAAARFLYLNKFCFNGLYRTNQDGKFNVPYGQRMRGENIDYRALEQASQVLKHVDLINADFQVGLARARAADFVFLDPPYALSAHRLFVEYLPSSFSPGDIERFAQSLIDLDRRGVYFVATYAKSKEILRFVNQWTLAEVQTKRNIAGFAGNRKMATEIVITNITLPWTSYDN
jgi:DNA adenine methylase